MCDGETNTYELIGRATAAWSAVELDWFLIFVTVYGPNREAAEAVYFTPNSSAMERKLTLNVAKLALKEHPEVFQQLKELEKRTSDMSADRNAIAHGKFIFSRQRSDKSVLLWEVGKNKLRGKDLDAVLRDMEIGFRALADDLDLMIYRVSYAMGVEPPDVES